LQRILIFVPGIVTWPGASRNWNNRAVTHTQTTTVWKAETFEYWCGPLTRALGQKRRATQLARKLEFYAGWKITLAGHSNGCDLIVKVLQNNPGLKVQDLHLFCAATERDFEKNGINQAMTRRAVQTVKVYLAGQDQALRFARHNFGRWLGYGVLGLLGPTNVLPQFARKVQVLAGFPWSAYGHSTCWQDERLTGTMDHIFGLV
jgi:hypothetical protein